VVARVLSVDARVLLCGFKGVATQLLGCSGSLLGCC